MEWSGVEQSKGRRERREPNNEQEKKIGRTPTSGNGRVDKKREEGEEG